MSKADFKRLARFKPDAASRLDALIAAMDANKDGRATRAEFEAAPMPLFERADANGDGRIDANHMMFNAQDGLRGPASTAPPHIRDTVIAATILFWRAELRGDASARTQLARFGTSLPPDDRFEHR